LIVADSSVWIDLLNGQETPAAVELTQLIEANAPIATTGMIVTEILRGYRDDAAALHIEEHLRAYPMLELQGVDDWSFAARLYRDSRRRGVTVRNGADCVIAAPCIREGAELLHQDADFDRLATVSDLKIWQY
jgi:predicted nucleic acid-binding protein